MDKVKLPKEVAGAIAELQDRGKENSLLLDFNYLAEDEVAQPIWDFIDGDNPNLERIGIYYQAIVNGYEVEQPPEDKVRELFAKLNNRYAQNAVIEMFNLLNVKIEGVNA